MDRWGDAVDVRHLLGGRRPGRRVAVLRPVDYSAAGHIPAVLVGSRAGAGRGRLWTGQRAGGGVMSWLVPTAQFVYDFLADDGWELLVGLIIILPLTYL